MAEIETANGTNSTSPPPNCAICLGSCTNKCFSDSCMHQFCFKCLLEWSKVKAVCPLCKQPFTSIIHNVKSNNEYDEHIVEPLDVLPAQDLLDDSDYLLLPPSTSSRHFQFRTTFTVDPRGELAIQQMLLTHPLTNSVYMPDYNYSNHRFIRHRRRDSSMNFRRGIYNQGLWVTSPPDITGRYRDISPTFYRENPAARNRLVPWLNRELNALLEENTQQVMHLVDVILGHLNRHHIRGRFFKNLLREYIGNRTDHFIHEFYNFMRSPYDMIGYDRHTLYSFRPPYTYTISEDDSDSDVTVIETSTISNTNPFHRPTIEVIEINSDSSRDSDVIIHEPPPPVIVDLLNSDSDENVINLTANSNEENQTHSDNDSKSKISKLSKRENSKLKVKEKSVKRRKHFSVLKSTKCLFTSSDSDNSDSSDSNYDKITYKFLRKKRKQKLKANKRCKYNYIYSDSSDTETQLHDKGKKLKESDISQSCKKVKSKNHHKDATRPESPTNNIFSSDPSTSNYKCNDFTLKEYNVKYVASTINVPLSNFHFQNNDAINKSDYMKSDNAVTMPIDYSPCRTNFNSNTETNVSCKVDNEYFPGPSNGLLNYNTKIKKEACNVWYARPPAHDSDSSVD